MEIAIGLPAFNEEKTLPELILELQKLPYKIIICNDGSTDNTARIAEKFGVITINHQKNLGYGASIKSIFQKAHEIKTDILVTFDADGQHRIEDIENIIEPIIRNDANIVIGSRFLEDNSDIPGYRKIGIKSITKLTNSSLKQKLTDSQSGFRAYDKKILENINLSDSGMGVSTEILIKASNMDFKILEVPITVLYEGDTSTHNPISHAISVIMSTIKYTSIQNPLKFYGLSGILFLIFGLYFISWSLIIYADEGKMITNITLVGIGLTLLGIIFFISGIILYSIITTIKESK